MERTCGITGALTDERQGLFGRQLRPSLQAFLKEQSIAFNDNTFISYNALNDLLRSYIAELNSKERDAENQLLEKIKRRFESEEALQPINPNMEMEPLTFGEKVSDTIADFGGSWKFIFIFFLFIFGWMGINVYLLSNKGYDPYPFILLNLILSCIAALQAPIIMMSQNRIEARDRIRNEYDFKVDFKAEKEIRLLHEKVDHILHHQQESMIELLQLHLDLMQQMQQSINTLKSNP